MHIFCRIISEYYNIWRHLQQPSMELVQSDIGNSLLIFCGSLVDPSDLVKVKNPV